MKTIGLVLNKEKHKVAPVVEKIYHWLQGKNIRVLITDECAEILNINKNYYPLSQLAGMCDCLMVWGGDGTILNCARAAAPAGTPIYGVNAGRLGFLTEVDIPDLLPGLEKLIAGNYTVEERMMIEARVYRKDKLLKTLTGLNDAVISKGAFARLIWLELHVNGEHMNSYPADGVIVASSTGSTAYSLSAGGPIVGPDLDLMVVTPICPHTLSARPLVISPDYTISVMAETNRGEIVLTVDGQCRFDLESFDVVQVRQAPYNAKFIRTENHNFYEILRKKLEEWNSSHV
ncbi:NAD(+)/NADH kinase [Desulfofalx alkaliphila]|uniref:NAD(+)/NADH kinase n=1 Tax=Desulfofalx alkaliphila TaxID=105483 RepID=UPI0004E12877|nr:NAD(+)/NADH kinase [Desulfofalx alkaliphila]